MGNHQSRNRSRTSAPPKSHNNGRSSNFIAARTKPRTRGQPRMLKYQPQPQTYENVQSYAPPPQKQSGPMSQLRESVCRQRDLSPALLQHCRNLIDTISEEVVKYHNDLINNFLNTKGAYEDSQIRHYHGKTAAAVISAFQTSVLQFHKSLHPNLSNIVEEAATKIYATIHSQLDVHIRKHEIATERISREIKMCTLVADNVFHEAMDAWDMTDKNREELQAKCKEAEKIALVKFKELLQEKGYDANENQYELRFRLAENFRMMETEWLNDAQAVSKPIDPQPELNPHHDSPKQAHHPAQLEAEVNSPSNKLQDIQNASSHARQIIDSKLPQPPEPPAHVVESRLSRPPEHVVDFNLPQNIPPDHVKTSDLLEPLPSPPTATAKPSLPKTLPPSKIVINNGWPTQKAPPSTTKIPQPEFSQPSSNGYQAKTPAITPNTHATDKSRSIHVGITICEGHLMVGTFNSSTQSVDIHVDDQPEVSVLSDNDGHPISEEKQLKHRKNFLPFEDEELASSKYNVIIGNPTDTFSPLTSFNLYQITQSCPKDHKLTTRRGTRLIHTSDVIRLFLEKVKTIVTEEAGIKPVGNLVIAIESTASSGAKFWLKRAGAELGFSSVRILPSVLAAGISHIRYNGLCNAQNTTRLLFIQYFRMSFSMAAVEVTGSDVVSKVTSGSENCVGADGRFQRFHMRMYDGGRVDRDEQAHIKRTYEEAIAAVKNANRFLVDHVICISPSRTSINGLIEGIVRASRLSLHNPSLEGACLIASEPEGIVDNFPARIKVFDSSRVDLILSVFGQEKRFNRMHCIFEPRIIFSEQVNLPVKRRIIVKLLECFHPRLPRREVCRYGVSIMEDKRKRIDCTVTCSVDEDGLYSLQFHTNKNCTLMLTRMDGVGD